MGDLTVIPTPTAVERKAATREAWRHIAEAADRALAGPNVDTEERAALLRLRSASGRLALMPLRPARVPDRKEA